MSATKTEQFSIRLAQAASPLLGVYLFFCTYLCLFQETTSCLRHYNLLLRIALRNKPKSDDNRCYTFRLDEELDEYDHKRYSLILAVSFFSLLM